MPTVGMKRKDLKLLRAGARSPAARYLVLIMPALARTALAVPDVSGTGWHYAELNLDVRILPRESRLKATCFARVRYDGTSSSGPSFVLGSTRGNEPFLTYESLRVDRPADVRLNAPYDQLSPARLAEIRLAEPASHGDEIEIVFEIASTGQAFQFVVNERAAIASWTHAWYPLPLSGVDDSFADVGMSTGTTRFEMPAGWRSVSNGRLSSRDDLGNRVVETWKVEQPVLRSFATGPYRVQRQRVGTMDVGVYLLASTQTSARDQAVILSRAIEAMVDRFGPYPYPSYCIAEVPEHLVDWSASSEQGFIMAKSSAFDDQGGNLPLFAHEAAHGWWGNLINQSGPGGIFCSESLAQYSAALAIESLEGQAAATEFLRFSRRGYNRRQCARGYFELASQRHDKALSEITGSGWEHDLSDAKGHWVYHMLRRRVGDDLFFRTLRDLIRDFAGRSLTLEDMRNAFVRAAPGGELELFFREWLDRPGAPVLDVEFQPNDAAPTSKVDITVRQVQEGPPYHLFVDISIEGEMGSSMETIEIRERASRVTLPSRGTVKATALDPQHRLLIWTPEYGPRP